MTPHKKYLHFDPAFVIQAVSKRMQERGLAEPADLGARVGAALSARGCVWITREQLKQAAEKAREYSDLYYEGKYEPLMGALANFRRVYQGGAIPADFARHDALDQLQETDDHSYNVLLNLWNDLALSNYMSSAVTGMLLEFLAAGMLKHPVRAKLSKVFWTLAPKGYDYATTRTVGTDTLFDPAIGREFTARQVEIVAESDHTLARNVEYQRDRYQSGGFDLTENNPLDEQREEVKKSQDRSRVWEEEAKKTKELTAWLLDPARTAAEVQGKRREAFDRGLTEIQRYPQYAPSVYDQALAVAEVRDKQQKERDEKIAREGAEKRRYALLVPKNAPLRFLYQHDEKIAALVADDVLSGAVSLKAAQNAVEVVSRDRSGVDYYVMLPVQALDPKTTYQDFFELVSKSNLYLSGKNAAVKFDPSEEALNDANLDPREIPREYALTRKEAYAALPEAVREAIKKHQNLRGQIDAKEWGWEKVKKYENSYGYSPFYGADYVVFSSQGRKLGSNTTAFKQFVAEAQSARGY